MAQALHCFLCLLLGCGLAACASLEHDGTHQVVRVLSEPPGATVVQNGKTFCTTPCLVDLPRHHRQSLLLTEGETQREVPVQGRYRWGGSFGANFAWFIYGAPIGWATDLITGAAWELKDPAAATIPESTSVPTSAAVQNKGPKVIAVAPPQAQTMDLADEGGEFLEKILQLQYPHAKVLPYTSTLAAFARNSQDFNAKPDDYERRRLHYELGADQVFESHFERNGDDWRLIGALESDEGAPTSENKRFEFEPSSEVNSELWRTYFKWIHILPNTPALELTNQTTQVTVNGQPYVSHRISHDDLFDIAGNYISAIGLYHLEPPRRERSSYWRFEFVPALQLSYRTFGFDYLTPIQDIEFRYLRVAGGYGVEGGWQNGRSYFYINYIPMLGWHRLRWEQGTEDHELSVGAFSSRIEVGYLYFFNQHYSLRLFARTVNDPSKVLSQAISEASNSTIKAESPTDNYAGLSFAYTFGDINRIKQKLANKMNNAEKN